MTPVIQWAAANRRGLRYSYCVPLATACFGMIFAIYLNVVPAARVQVDPIHENRNKRREKRVLERQKNRASTETTAQKFGLSGIIARHGKQQSGLPTTEHVERPGQKEKEEDIVQMSAPQGMIGDLQPWPGQGGESSSSHRSEKSPEPEPDITRHRPKWEEDNEDELDDDYHAIMRRDLKKR